MIQSIQLRTSNKSTKVFVFSKYTLDAILHKIKTS